MLAAAALTLLAWTQPTGKVVLVLAVVALAAIGAIQLVAGMDRTARRDQESVPEDQLESGDR